MKKGSKFQIFFALFIMVAYASLIIGYVGVKQQCDFFIKNKFDKQKELDTERNKTLNLIADVQFLSSEERIVPVARDEFKMIKRSEPKIKMSVDKAKIKKISDELREKYE